MSAQEGSVIVLDVPTTKIEVVPGLWTDPATLLSALDQRRLEKLTVVALGIKQCRCYDISSGDLWKFWRPMRTLKQYA